MGNNDAFTIFEANVMRAYNLGVLSRELLSNLMERYRGMDIDNGGKAGTLSKDNFGVEEIVILTFGRKLPKKPELPRDYTTWTKKQSRENDVYHAALYTAFSAITDKFEWR